MGEKKAFLVYHSDEGLFNALTDEDAGKVIKAMIAYSRYQETPDLEGYAAFAWAALKGRIDDDAEHYEKVRAARAEAGRLGGKQTQANARFAKQNKQTQANQANTIQNNTIQNNNNYENPPVLKTSGWRLNSVDECVKAIQDYKPEME